ncbi:MAG TPA: hypothetical protein VKV04_12470 [Verrucomicrobiae bacterium]|nr:hypothetical protein [Verrucomicrobiae bacterium]
MKKIIELFVLSVSIAVAHAQDAVITEPVQAVDNQVPVATVPAQDVAAPEPVAAPTVVYSTPVVYTAPVVYQAPVAYYAPVSYNNYNVAPRAARASCDYQQDCSPVSTVVYIGGGQTRYQYSDACSTSGSTVTYIGCSRR